MSHSLYVIAHKTNPGFRGPVKIGIAANPEARLKELQTGNPHRIGILWTFNLADRAEALTHEQRLHIELARDRMMGEWFNVEPQHAIHLLCASMRLHERRQAAGGKFDLALIGVLAAERHFPPGKIANLTRAA